MSAEPQHNDMRNRRMETVRDAPIEGRILPTGAPITIPGSSLTQSVDERYCARCGWIEVRGVMGGLTWYFEHEKAHAPEAVPG